MLCILVGNSRQCTLHTVKCCVRMQVLVFGLVDETVKAFLVMFLVNASILLAELKKTLH